MLISQDEEITVRRYKCLQQAVFTHGNYTLISIRDEDKYAIMQWRNEQIDILRQKEKLTKEDQERYFRNVVDKLFDEERPGQLLFSFLENDRLVGYGGLVHIDWQSGNSEISFLTQTDRNLSREQFKKDWAAYLVLLKRMTLSQLKFFKIYTYAYDIRPVLFEMLAENGFHEEAKLRKHILVAGALHDVLIHSYFFDDIAFRPADENAGTVMMTATVNDVPVGQIRFEEISSDHYEIDFSVDQGYRGRSLGTKILANGVKELLQQKPAVKVVTGKVKGENEAAMRAFVSAGFENIAGGDGVTTFKINRIN